MRRFIPICIAILLLVLAGCGSSDSPQTSTSSSKGELRLDQLSIDSQAVDRELEVSVIAPAGAAGDRPLLVFLHGAGGSHQSFVDNEAVLSSLAQLGAKAPVLAFPEGELGWWHNRDSGDWEDYVIEEVIPAVTRRFDTDPRRVAVGGISMGGFGAYHLGLERPRRFCAVGGHSAGLWPDPSEEFPGAFDDAAAQERNDVLAAVEADPDAFGSARVWNDYGDRDWFVRGNAAFVAALESSTPTALTAHVWPGGHDAAYWDAHFPTYLRFYANALAHCG